ncbi:MAG: two-component system, NtrC family, nitrogen regulation sensor histidine kinase NtrY [Acidobacteriota bacterium]|jgi:nitrogen fixation/metabolism regulation signal transduction histidine kinase|nr:two-component system, NtrC family, nitrogen regulation sensor histidine kinase NtrY [Acidobacteriota bacterium]
MGYEGRRRQRKPRLNFDQRLFWLALLAGLPGSATALIMLWTGAYAARVQWTLTVFIVGFLLGCAGALRGRVVRHLQTLSNLLAALREGDYSIRARGSSHDDALGEVMTEVNALGETLREQRLGAMEATALVRTVMAEIEVAIFAFDAESRLRLINRAGERLLAQPAERLIGRGAAELNLADCLDGANGEEARTLQKTFPGGTGRWGVRCGTFRAQGLPHQLLVLSDLTRELREEELDAWRRLVRVLGHELNNSLTPIKSIAGSLETLLSREPRPTDWRDDMQRGLSIIGARSESLSRFMQAYARLARLPAPRHQPVEVGGLVRRVAALETRLSVQVLAGPEVIVEADGDQLEQLLINLIRNAVDAALQTGGSVSVGWSKVNTHLDLSVEDEGPGLPNTSNLFVPFFTTKPGGTGIGLILSRQIAEAHGGTLKLANRRQGTGCVARLRLPISAA